MLRIVDWDFAHEIVPGFKTRDTMAFDAYAGMNSLWLPWHGPLFYMARACRASVRWAALRKAKKGELLATSIFLFFSKTGNRRRNERSALRHVVA
jgi:hypothetical protein